MKKLLIVLQVLMFVTVFTSCDGPKKSVDNQTANQPVSPSVDQAAAVDTNAVKPDGTQQMKTTQKDHTSREMTGSGIVDMVTKKLNNKLKLTPEQSPKVKGIVSSTFLSLGEDLNKKYTGEESKTLSRTTLDKSKDSIVPLLDENQKKLLSELGQK